MKIHYILKQFFKASIICAIFHVLATTYNLVFASFSYMGVSDTSMMEGIFSLYSHPILITILEIFCLNVLVHTLCIVPFLILFPNHATKISTLLLKLTWLCFSTYWLWISFAFLRSPTLFSEIYYGNGRGFVPFLLRILSTPWGFTIYALLLTFAFLLCLKRSGIKLSGKIAVILYFILFGAFISSGESYIGKIRLPRGSVVVFIGDSLRTAESVRNILPKTAETLKNEHFYFVKEFTPPLARTTPSITSLLTGKYPFEHNVTSIFSRPHSFHQKNSLPDFLRDMGYCTLFTGEFPAEMASKIDFGFEFLDVPSVTLKDLSLKVIISKQPFALAALSWWNIRRFSPSRLENLIEGMPTFASPLVLVKKFNTIIKTHCNNRKIFAVIFFNQSHFPYVQTFPHYWNTPFSHSGAFRFLKNINEKVIKKAEKEQIRRLFRQSTNAIDEILSLTLKNIITTNTLDSRFIYIMGDHGESLYDESDIIGHGDQIEDSKGNSSIFIAASKNLEFFKNYRPDRIQNTYFPKLVLTNLGMESSQFNPSLPIDSIYLETGLWLMEGPNLPKNRIKYPNVTEILTIDSKSGCLVLKEKYTRLTEYAKFRSFEFRGDIYRIFPGEYSLNVTKNDLKIDYQSLPENLRQKLKNIYDKNRNLRRD